MQKYLEDIRNAIKEPLSKIGMIVDDINYKCENKYKFVNIVLDKEGGIDMDTIMEATKLINPIIDSLDIGIDDYILDVSSKERNGN